MLKNWESKKDLRASDLEDDDGEDEESHGHGHKHKHKGREEEDVNKFMTDSDVEQQS